MPQVWGQCSPNMGWPGSVRPWAHTQGHSLREPPLPHGGSYWSVEVKCFLQRPAGLSWPREGLGRAAACSPEGHQRASEALETPFSHLMDENNELQREKGDCTPHTPTQSSLSAPFSEDPGQPRMTFPFSGNKGAGRKIPRRIETDSRRGELLDS